MKSLLLASMYLSILSSKAICLSSRTSFLDIFSSSLLHSALTSRKCAYSYWSLFSFSFLSLHRVLSISSKIVFSLRLGRSKNSLLVGTLYPTLFLIANLFSTLSISAILSSYDSPGKLNGSFSAFSRSSFVYFYSLNTIHCLLKTACCKWFSTTSWFLMSRIALACIFSRATIFLTNGSVIVWRSCSVLILISSHSMSYCFKRMSYWTFSTLLYK